MVSLLRIIFFSFIFLFISLIILRKSRGWFWLYLLVAPADVAGEVVHVVVFLVERWGRGADEVVGLDVGRGHLVEERLRAHTALQVVSTIHSAHLSVPMCSFLSISWRPVLLSGAGVALKE